MAKTSIVARRQLGDLIAQHRNRLGLNQKQLGQRAFPTTSDAQTKITAWETGERSPRSLQLEALQDALEITDPELRAAMARMLEASAAEGRWATERLAYPQNYWTRVDLEKDADLIRQISVFRIPDLLMCESYIQTVVEVRRTRARAGFKDLVAARVDRTKLLDETDREFHFIIWEAAIRHTPKGDGAAVRQQVAHLQKLSRKSNVTIQVIPFWLSSRTPGDFVLSPFAYLHIPAEPFSREFEYVHLGERDHQYLTRAEDIAPYRERRFNEAKEVALGIQDTRTWLRETKVRHR